MMAYFLSILKKRIPIIIALTILFMIAAVVLMCFQYRQRQTVKVLSDRLSRLLMEGRYDEFEELLKYARKLEFEEEPDYKAIKNMFKKYIEKNGEKMNMEFEWMLDNLKDSQEEEEEEDEKK